MSIRSGLKLTRFLFFLSVTCAPLTLAAQSNPPTQSPTASAFGQVLALITQAQQKLVIGKTDEAISLAERAVQLGEKELGPEHGAVGMALALLAEFTIRTKIMIEPNRSMNGHWLLQRNLLPV